MRLLTPRRVGLLILLAGAILFAGSTYWMNTRDYRPLDSEFSFAPGKAQYSFDVNMNGVYDFGFAIKDTVIGEERIRCLLSDCGDHKNIFHAHWKVTQRGRVIAEGNTDGGKEEDWYSFEHHSRTIASLPLARGSYVFEVELLSDASLLNQGEPRVFAMADWSTGKDVRERDTLLRTVASFLAAIGLAIVLLRGGKYKTNYWPASSPQPKTSGLAAPDRIRRFPGYGRRLEFTFGYLATIIFAVLVFIFMIMSPHSPTGVWIGILKRSELGTSSTYAPPVIVHVSVTVRRRAPTEMAALHLSSWDNSEIIEHFRINESTDLDEATLKTKLREILVTRADRTVYVVGDPDVPFQAAADAISNAKVSYASRVVLLTTRGNSPAKKH
ncbi:hypothetical protein Acid345_4146 [Candidatus Koribacter versatilis Ellin345]|uniref:Uncharacterized protein n=1 Tax=Koribacter versatilis (strain Ellin345) TaxID=204669 RepID=Q1IJ04_KORVE|nr:hypothetical protein [Candidatus Koribacter versatilis]ABF43146.1 hypothetical protein Acid345_4146 [Candidatus Koribacter versatilis Ellin345]